MCLLKGDRVYFVGIKGTGMCALAELMHNQGILVSGSDTSEVFYTDSILQELKIPYHESFDASHITNADLVVFSAAYSEETNPEITEAKKKGIPVQKYTEALGDYSAKFDSTGIAGVHGKTTTTALAGTLLKAVKMPVQVLAGSVVSTFDGNKERVCGGASGNEAAVVSGAAKGTAYGERSTLYLGNKYFVAETCEYRKHFLSFHPQRIVLTSVESDHQDYFPGYEDIREAFMEYGRLLPDNGELIYCADDPGASEVALALKREKSSIELIPYGFSTAGDFGIEEYQVKNERIVMRLRSFPGELKLRIPGRHTALNAAGAVALTSVLVRKEFGNGQNDGWDDERRAALIKALEEFSGSRRRSEIVGEAGRILFMDDYGHHPTAIKMTLQGLKEFYPRRRLVLSFMSHTYTRTEALLGEFAASFDSADLIILHKIYASARETYKGGVSGWTLFEKTRENLRRAEGDRLYYVEEPETAFDLVRDMLKPGDLFVTMGAGDNWKLGNKLFNYFRGKEHGGSE